MHAAFLRIEGRFFCANFVSEHIDGHMSDLGITAVPGIKVGHYTDRTNATGCTVILCEDGPEDQFLVGVTPEGELYKLGYNAFNTSEFAGAVFSPDGGKLYVNIQNPGITLAIRGPWKGAM